jgi:hypothetical protein
MVTRMDQEVMSSMVLVDYATQHMQNPTIAANKMKDFITTLAGLPPSQGENQIVQLNEQDITQATTITEVRDRNSALMKEGRDLVENRANLDKELALT